MSTTETVPNTGTRNHDDINALKDSLMVFDLISERIQLTKHGAEYKGLCPFHDDHSPSLIVNPSKNLWYCPVCPPQRPGKSQLGGDIYDWMYAMGHTLPDAYKILMGESAAENRPIKNVSPNPDILKTLKWTQMAAPGPASIFTNFKYNKEKSTDDKPIFDTREPDAIHRYNNQNGTISGYVCRFNTDDGKDTLPYIFAKNGDSGKQEWRYLGFQDAYRPLYNADLIAQNPDAIVVMVEGEKCADYIGGLLPVTDFVATTWVGGANAVSKTNMSQLNDREVIFWPDNDEPGFKCMGYAFSAIIGKKRTLRPPAGVPDHWDAADSEFNAQQLRDFIVPPLDQLLDHADIPALLTSQLERVDFRERSGLTDPTEKLTRSHYLIGSIELIQDAAIKKNWGLCVNEQTAYLYNGGFWKALDGAALKVFLGKSAQKMGVDQFVAKYYRFRDDLSKQFESSSVLPAPVKLKDTVLINLKNGTFEISTDKQLLREPKREDFLKYQLGFGYDANATAPMFTKFLNQALPDVSQQKILAEYLGSIFIKNGTIKIEKALVLYGSGANGKSVVSEIITALLGRDNVINYSVTSLTDTGSYTRALMGDALLNYGSEMGAKLETEMFKNLTSGEPVGARRIFKAPFIMYDYAKMMFNCNELPTNTEQTDAYYRRFIILRFGVTIPERDQDRRLASKIIASELPGIFNWVLDGLRRLIAQGDFTYSEVSAKQLSDFRVSSDTALCFLRDAGYDSHASETITYKQLYEDYYTYCVNSNIRPPLTKIKFKENLESSGIRSTIRNVGAVFFLSKRPGFSNNQ